MTIGNVLAAFTLAAVLPSGCTDPPTGARQPNHERITFAGLLASDVTLNSTGEAAARAYPQVWTWVSLPPGSAVDFSLVRIRNLTANAVMEPIPILEGGFDPVPVPAREGDQLELAFSHASGSTGVAFMTVPPWRSPTIVRTAPPRGRTDVALNVRPVIIFSEPMDVTTLDSGSVRLLAHGVSVEGTIVATPQPIVAEFVPVAPLAPSTVYELTISQDVRDAQGQALQAPVSVTFTTAPAVPRSATIVVSSVTTGGAFDPDGFVVAVDGAAAVPMELNDAIRLDNLPAGAHTIELRDVAANCTVEGGASRDITVTNVWNAPVELGITCTPPPELASIRIAFARSTGDSPPVVGSSIVAMNGDGSGRVQLTSGAFNDYGPDISPDGRTIAFMRDALNDAIYNDPSIFAMNVDGTGLRGIISGPAYDPDWSPDGHRIVFSGGIGLWGGPIRVAPAEGGSFVALTGGGAFDEDAWPAWSPDGTRIAFTRQVWPDIGIWVMNADGSGVARRAGGGAWGPIGPVWSPDGMRIAFSDGEPYPNPGSSIRVMNADGSGVYTLYQSTRWLRVGDWSADGKLLLFAQGVGSPTSSRTDLFLLRVEDGAITRLTADGVFNSTPTFWQVNPAIASGR